MTILDKYKQLGLMAAMRVKRLSYDSGLVDFDVFSVEEPMRRCLDSIDKKSFGQRVPAEIALMHQVMIEYKDEQVRAQQFGYPAPVDTTEWDTFVASLKTDQPKK